MDNIKNNIKLQSREYYLNNKKKILDRQKIYYQQNKKKLLEYQKQYLNNKKKDFIFRNKLNLYDSKYYKLNKLGIDNKNCNIKIESGSGLIVDLS